MRSARHLPTNGFVLDALADNLRPSAKQNKVIHDSIWTNVFQSQAASLFIVFCATWHSPAGEDKRLRPVPAIWSSRWTRRPAIADDVACIVGRLRQHAACSDPETLPTTKTGVGLQSLCDCRHGAWTRFRKAEGGRAIHPPHADHPRERAGTHSHACGESHDPLPV